jgi:hypothetical protein
VVSNRTIPDLNDSDEARYWGAIESAKRRLSDVPGVQLHWSKVNVAEGPTMNLPYRTM